VNLYYNQMGVHVDGLMWHFTWKIFIYNAISDGQRRYPFANKLYFTPDIGFSIFSNICLQNLNI